MAKVIQRIYELKDKITPNLNKIKKGTVQYKKDVQDLKNAGASAFKALGIGVAALTAGVVAAGVGIKKVLNDSRAEANAAIEAETKLTTVMKQRMNATEDMINSVKDLTNAQQDLGVVGGNEQIFGAAELATYLEYEDSLKTLMPAVNDLVAAQYGYTASGDQVVGMATMIGKVMDGQVGALSRYGFTFDEAQEKILKYGEESERAALIAEIVKDSLGNMNEALGQTPEGRALRLKNMLGSLKEEIGRGIAIPIHTKGVEWLLETIPKVREFAIEAFDAVKNAIAENSERFEAIKNVFVEIKDGIMGAFGSDGEGGGAIRWFIDEAIPAVVGGVASILEGVTNTYTYIRDNWSLISPIVYGIVGALGAYVAITKAVTFWTYAKTAATMAWRAAINMTPIGWLITGIGLLIAAGVFLVKNWEDVKLAGKNLWNSIVTGAEWMVNTVIKGINWMIDQALKPINKLIDGINNIPGIKKIDNLALGIDDVSFGAAQFDTEGQEYSWGRKEEEESPFGENLSAYEEQQQMLVGGYQVSNENLAASLDSNTAMLEKTRGGGNTFNITVNGTDLTAEQIADILVPRIERKLCGS